MRPAALTGAPDTVFAKPFPILGTVIAEVMMDRIHTIETVADRGLAALYLAAEEADFLWEARSRERWLGAVEPVGDTDAELDRVAILGRFDGRWFAAVCDVDGDGHPHAIGHVRDCRTIAEAEAVYALYR